MCDPATMTASAVVVGTLFSVQAQREQGKFNKGVAAYNARVSENQAQDVRKAGAEEENIKRRQTAELLSKQRAQLGAAGVELTSGSAAQLQEDTVTLGEADALRIRSNFEDQAESLETGAGLTRTQGAFAERAGTVGAAGTLFTGAGVALDTGVADKWFTPSSAANQPQAQT